MIIKIPTKDVYPTPKEIEKILYKKKFNKKDIFRGYFNFINPTCYFKNIDKNIIKEIFIDSLPKHSPIYKAIDEFILVNTFIFTLGDSIDKSIKSSIKQNNSLISIIIDTIASFIVEKSINLIQKEWKKNIISQKIDYKKKGVARYSPGHCSWNIKGQIPILGYMADMDIPVSIKENNRLYPAKSMTGIIVIEKKDLSSPYKASCRKCNKKCQYITSYKV